ncbi:MAG: hypothetical protein REI11_03895, partial [Patulibacter sp.]|nr:hypothetical protein [Patulibacter sp.]
NRTGRPAFVRRISPAGTLGPELPIDAGIVGSTYAAATFAGDGTFVVALSIDAADAAGNGREPTGVYAASLLRGATRFGPVTRLGAGGNSSTQQGNLSIAVDRHRQVTVLAGAEDQTLRVFDHGPSGWRLAARLRAPFAFDAEVHDAPDMAPTDGTTVIWDDTADQSSTIGRGATAVFAAHRTENAAFGPPHRITALVGGGGVSLDSATYLPSGRIALVATRYGGPDDEGHAFAAIANP